MADINLKIFSDFQEAEKDFKSLYAESETARKQIDKFNKSFDPKHIDEFTAKNKLATAGIKATKGPLAASKAEVKGLEKEMIRLTKQGLNPASASFKKLESNLIDARQDMNKLIASEKKATTATKKHRKETLSMGTALKGALAYMSISVIKNFGSALVKAASDAEETANKYNVVFRDSLEISNAAVEDLTNNYGLATVEARKFLSNTADVAMGLGVSSDEAADLSSRVQTLAVDLASFSNVEGGTARASKALTSSLTGEREALKAYGIVINESIIKDELKLRGQDKLTGAALMQAKAEATVAIAYRQSGNALGDMNRSYDDFANVQRRVENRAIDMSAVLGEDLKDALGNLGLAFLNSTKDGNVLFTALGKITSAAANVINMFAELSTIMDTKAAQKEQVEMNKVAKWYLFFAKAAKIAGDNKTYLDFMDKAKVAMNGAMDASDRANASTSERQKILDRVAKSENDINKAVANREKSRGKDDKTPKTPSGKISPADAAAYYESIGELDNAEYERINLQATTEIENARLMYTQKKIDREEYQQAMIDIDVNASESKLKVETELRQKTEAEQKKLTLARVKFGQTALSMTGSMLTDLQTIFANAGSDSAALAYTLKGIAIAEASISSYLAFDKVLASTAYAYPLNNIFAGITLAAGLAKVGAIASTPIPSGQTGLNYTVPDTRSNSNDGHAVNASAGENVNITPRGEESGQTTTVIVQMNERELFRGVQKGIDSGAIKFNSKNIGKGVFAN